MKRTSFYLLAMLVLTFWGMAATAQTNVMGGIYSNTTWTLANSPYIVVDTVVIFPNVTLTIEPGVVVKFANATVLEARQGRINAIGTAVDSITFTSNAPSPAVLDWEKIHLNGGSLISTFEYCRFEYARNAMYNNHLNGNQNTTIELHIRHCRFSNNGAGILSMGNGGGFTLVDSTLFTNNEHGTQGSQFRLTHCVARDNTIGLFISPYSYTYTYIQSCTLKRNTYGISGSATVGAAFYSLRNSILDSNTVAGIVLGGYPTYIDTIIGCQITNNFYGVLDSFKSGLVLQQSVIADNQIGLYLKGPNQTVSCNRICPNSIYDFYYNSISNGFTAENNYWCTNDSFLISSQIYDGYDNINLSLVDFVPFDTAQCYFTGCNTTVTATSVSASCGTCTNGSATAYVANGLPPFVYSWNSVPSQSTQTATGLSPGVYSVTATDANGCTNTASVTVDTANCNGFALIANMVNSTCWSCSNGSASAAPTGGTAPYTYIWSTFPAQTTSMAINLSPGSYVVCATDLVGCTACDTVLVSGGNCSALFTLTPDSIPLSWTAVNLASGTGPLTYVWSWGDGSPNDTIAYPSHVYASAGYYTICLSIVDSTGCMSTYCDTSYIQKTGGLIYVNVVAPITGISTTPVKLPLTLFPNPATDELNIQFPALVDEAELHIYSLTGRLEQTSHVTGKDAKVDVSGLAQGLYILQLIVKGNVVNLKFVKE